MTEADWRQWIGRVESRADDVTATPVAALAATLDREDPPPKAGDPLPPLWHWLYFLPLHRQSEIGADGHAKRGGFLPPVPLPRRMWAGGRLTFLQPLRVGEPRPAHIAHRRRDDARKAAAAPLVFVLVRHDIDVARGARDHRGARHRVPRRPQAGRSAGIAAAPRRRMPRGRATLHPDDVLLFRYSALTFNGHRIHYDRRYVTEVEGYPGLVVHGPLIATLLLDLLRRQLARGDRRALFVPARRARCSTPHRSRSADGHRMTAAARCRCGRRTRTAVSRWTQRRRSGSVLGAP